MQWVLKNYFNITPSETLEKKDDENVYLENDFYYVSEKYSHSGWGDWKTLFYEAIDMGDDTYYIYYGVYMTNFEEAYGSLYVVLKRKYVDGIEFWSPIEAGDE